MATKENWGTQQTKVQAWAFGIYPVIPYCDGASARRRRSHFTDHKGCNRSKFADIWLPDGTVKSLSIEGAAILQGFPSWYEFPKETATAGSIIGYSVPPSFATQLFISAQSKLFGVTV
ncbi:MAG: DNA cytosine methyltransferase [Nostoc sp.]